MSPLGLAAIYQAEPSRTGRRQAGMDGAGAKEERVLQGLECKNKGEDMLLNTEHFVIDADPVGGHGTGCNVPSVFQSATIKEEVENSLGREDRTSLVKEEEGDGSYCMLQAAASTSEDSAALDCPINFASASGQLTNFLSDMNSVPLLPVVEFAQEPTDKSESHEQCEVYYSDETEKGTKKNNDRSGMCAEKATSAISGDLCRLASLQDACGPTTCRSSKCPSASVAAQQSYKLSSFLESGSSHGETKEKKELCDNPEILQPVRKKSRTFYSAEQLEELEKMFQEDHYPDNEKRREIATVVGVTPQRIMVWFQNRRAKWRKTEKLNVKGKKKYSASALSVPTGTDSSGVPLLPMPPLPDFVHDQSSVLNVDTTAGNCSSLLTGHSAPLASSSVSSVAGMVAACGAVQTKTLLQFNFSSSRMECFPSLPSPPPIRRASLPLSLSFNPRNHIVPLMLDTPDSECSLSSQENGSREAFTYSIQNQGLCSPVSCDYPEQLESPGSIETPYCQYSSQGGTYQLPQYPQQHQLSQFHHLPVHLASNVLSSVRLTPTTPTESSTSFLPLPGNSGVVTYGTAGATQGYVQNHMGGQLVLQQPSGNSAGITAYQAVPWNDFCMQGAPFLNQSHSRMPSSSTAGRQYLSEQTSYTQSPCQPSSPCFLQVPNGTTLGSMPHTGKQKEITTPGQSLYQSHRTEPELTSLAEREEVESSSKKGESIADIKEEAND
ncbi:homeobox protein NOBOX [Anser cygnoides]|uniref:homeobox protein NOBOX n=1 Tax=Anser cygnoides TaxID=8845 RepID=UPI0006713D35|nr:homeobox protein NOBOX [Anser cygnoides]